MYTSSSLGSAAPRTLLPGPCSCTDGVAVDDGVAATDAQKESGEDTCGLHCGDMCVRLRAWVILISHRRVHIMQRYVQRRGICIVVLELQWSSAD